eukprot:CAMPEP_0197873452 /NCGR_PEP_ID=MMETSP1439-20131203/3250_1 /TAXON_ID=66791 /ORGANISM="Gonyaulax spinifera, Strain CCMP409" /LENGTH=171 /DNA_ID=CAMNT_0043492507 /DNA_START=91 /DNA_END=604 /DNA_ORIENTATION=-
MSVCRSLAVLLVVSSRVLTTTAIFNPKPDYWQKSMMKVAADGQSVVETPGVLGDATSFAQVELCARAARPSVIAVDSLGHPLSRGSAEMLEEEEEEGALDDDNTLLQMESDVVRVGQPEVASMEEEMVIDTNPVFLLQGDMDLVRGWMPASAEGRAWAHGILAASASACVA